jgi:hypothetical protein
MDEAIRMLPQVLALDRPTVRQRFEQRFSATRMATAVTARLGHPCSGALALRSQPTCVVVPDNGNRFGGVVHAARYLHVLRAGAQHRRACPFN